MTTIAHYTVDDPFREQEGIDAVVAAVESAGATVEVFDYPGAGHLSPTRARRTSTSPPKPS